MQIHGNGHQAPTSHSSSPHAIIREPVKAGIIHLEIPVSESHAHHKGTVVDVLVVDHGENNASRYIQTQYDQRRYQGRVLVEEVEIM